MTVTERANLKRTMLSTLQATRRRGAYSRSILQTTYPDAPSDLVDSVVLEYWDTFKVAP